MLHNTLTTLWSYCLGAIQSLRGQDEGGGGQKMSIFVHTHSIKTVHARGGGQKMAKFCPRSC